MNHLEIEQGNCPATKLPPELLELVFGSLALDDLVNAQYVCRKWRSVSRADHLWNKLTFSVLNIPIHVLHRRLTQMPCLRNIEGHTDNVVFNVIMENLTKLRQMNCSFSPPLSVPQMKSLLNKYPDLESVTLHTQTIDFSHMNSFQTCQNLKEVTFRICGHELFTDFRNCLCDTDNFIWFNITVSRENFTTVQNLKYDILYNEIAKHPAPIQLLPNVLIRKTRNFVYFYMDLEDEKYKNIFNGISKKLYKLQKLYITIFQNI